IDEGIGGHPVRSRAWQRDPGPWRVSPSSLSGSAGPPIDHEASIVPGRQETASEASGPGSPDRIAPQEALVNFAAMVLIHD
ncbi:MAG: hypothetical protein U9N84_07455, partial [Actinomycetota bacterium]|nr:hypothetical protein [Actinomycetota bacterium]